MKEGKKEESFDGDYGSIPTFYVNLRIGDWDKPFKYVKPEPKIQKLERVIQVIEKPVVVEGQIEIFDYSEKAFAVIGDTKPIKDILGEMGGRFNRFLKCGAGWIFPKTREQKVRERLNMTVPINL
jgi:hypothetical protein